MTLLLLLSALLSALTGGSGPAVRVVAPQAVSRQAVASAVVKAVATAPSFRPEQPLPALSRQAMAPRSLVMAIAAAEPVFAGRRRE
ncbi:MAG: hypothetical protein ACRCSO_13355 [Sphingomonas sp.]